MTRRKPRDVNAKTNGAKECRRLRAFVSPPPVRKRPIEKPALAPAPDRVFVLPIPTPLRLPLAAASSTTCEHLYP